MAAFAIRAPSIDDLFDPFSPEPLDRRPLREEVRTRILRAWIDTKHERPRELTVELPVGGERPELARTLEAAIRQDLAATAEASRHFHPFTRGERREALVAFAFLVVCLFAANIIDQVTANDAFFTSISQGLVVLGWVAMWQPAQRLFEAVSRRLSHDRYQELAQVPIEVVWI